MSHPRKTLTLALGLGIALATVLGTASPAQAQYAPGYYPPPPPPPPPPRGVYRSGLIFGGSIGLGGFWYSQCNDICGGAGAIEGHIGGMVAPRLAIMGDFWEGFHPFSSGGFSGTTYQGIYTLAAQFWLSDNLWIKGGLGLGYLTVSSDIGYYYNGYTYSTSVSDSAFAFMLAAGIELYQAYNYALDLQLRYGNAVYTGAGLDSAGDTNMVTVMIGFNWY